MNEQELKELIIELVKTTIDIIEKEKLYEKTEPIYFEYIRHKVTEFQYDDAGTHIGLSSETFVQPFYSNLDKLVEQIIKTEEFIRLSDFLNTNLKEAAIVEISFFVKRLINKYYEKRIITQSDIDKIVQDFTSNITYTNPEVGVVVQLLGLIIHPDEIELAPGFIIRKPRKEDFEIERPVFYPISDFSFVKPTAFLKISKNDSNPIDIPEEITKTITILQLFRIGSVKYKRYRMYSIPRSSLGFGESFSGDTNHPIYTYIINETESQKLQYFWRAISQHIPHSVYKLDGSEKDHISIAFDRYKDALIQTGIDERRITNAIMGLEALYFTKDERSELDYRLRTRMAKVLGKISCDSVQVKNAVKSAYNIRSIFSHGSLLNSNQKEQYQIKYEEGVTGLTKLMVDFLRISLIVSITVEMKKEKFLDLIDNALISEAENEKLERILDNIREIIERIKV